MYFPTRIQNNSISAIDNIFIDLNRSGNCTISPHVNGLPAHDGWIMYINNINLEIHSSCTQLVRKFNKSSMNEFLIQLSYETWDNIFVLPLQSQYIFSLLLSVVKNTEQFKFNSEIHSINTRYNNNFHYPICNLTVFKKGTYYIGIKVFNNLPSTTKNLAHDMNQFRFALKRFLLLI
jgi:hypothetical protein